jgi:hypothetical protein
MERSARKPYPSDMSDDDWDVVFADMAHDLRARLRWSEGSTIERALHGVALGRMLPRSP